jgi:ketosteroid isomerase-like protein
MKDHMIAIARNLYDCIGKLDVDGACSLLADDVEAVYPFALGKAREDGREAVRTRLNAVVPRLFKSISFTFAKFYFCPEDNALIAQLSSTGVRAKGTLPYENEYVAILVFDGDQITYWAEYYDMIKGAGGIDRLVPRA